MIKTVYVVACPGDNWHDTNLIQHDSKDKAMQLIEDWHADLKHNSSIGKCEGPHLIHEIHLPVFRKDLKGKK